MVVVVVVVVAPAPMATPVMVVMVVAEQYAWKILRLDKVRAIALGLLFDQGQALGGVRDRVKQIRVGRGRRDRLSFEGRGRDRADRRQRQSRKRADKPQFSFIHKKSFRLMDARSRASA